MLKRFQSLFTAAFLLMALGPAVAGERIATDQITTAAIDVAKSTIETRFSRVPRGATLEIAFAPVPQRAAERLVIKVIDAAETSVFMAAYQMTSKPIADALCRAATRGAAVSVVLDQRSNPHGEGNSKRDYLISCGVDVKGDARYPIMHDKFIVVDGQHVETGSFNYSFAAAERNAENALVVWNNADMAKRFEAEFERLFTEADD